MMMDGWCASCWGRIVERAPTGSCSKLTLETMCGMNCSPGVLESSVWKYQVSWFAQWCKWPQLIVQKWYQSWIILLGSIVLEDLSSSSFLTKRWIPLGNLLGKEQCPICEFLYKWWWTGQDESGVSQNFGMPLLKPKLHLWKQEECNLEFWSVEVAVTNYVHRLRGEMHGSWLARSAMAQAPPGHSSSCSWINFRPDKLTDLGLKKTMFVSLSCKG